MNRELKLGVYRHFKGKEYKVLGIAQHSETGEEMVIYKALYGNGNILCRPKYMFMSEVDHKKYPQEKQKFRFKYIRESKGEDNE